MRFVADLHIHSYLSRATSKDLNLEQLHRWAQLKGISVVGTGDFTHPRWFAEIREKLVPAADGLFALRPDLATAAEAEVPGACHGTVRFLLSVEISSIYKRGGKVRKVHNLVYVPDFESASRFTSKLARIGNVESDGRPILGVDSRDLLELALETSPEAFLIPAHIWTPWFSVLGAQSGFDALEECYGDLTKHIFAVETGLSSDPAMNWRLSALDRLALVSNSDAHSLEKLGREANLFQCELSYFALRDALKDRREGFLGTIEFFPEEGKYHFDGHRKCGVVLSPEEAQAAGGSCRVCGKPLTEGVMNRVVQLADRGEGARPENAKPFRSLVPLLEVIGEVVDSGVGTVRVLRAYERLLERVGPELGVLTDAPLEALEREGPPLLAEAMRRMRAGEVRVRPGFDGEYGVVRAFDDDERRRLLAQKTFAFGPLGPARAAEPLLAAPRLSLSDVHQRVVAGDELNPEQMAAVEHGEGALLIVAGPGTGKTRTIASRIAHLIRARHVSPRAITAIAFTRKAAGELRDRLHALLGDPGERVSALTFHAFGLELLRLFAKDAGLPEDFLVLDEVARLQAVEESVQKALPSTSSVARMAERISWAKAHLFRPEAAAPAVAEIAPAYHAYQQILSSRSAVDFDDLVFRTVELLESSAPALAAAKERCRYLFLDEYQDINAAQYRLVRLIASSEATTQLCAVGDPDQAIYGFRGSDPSYFTRFALDYPGATIITLTRNYRSAAPILSAATHVIERSPGRAPRSPPLPLSLWERVGVRGTEENAFVQRFSAANEAQEADFIASEIERAVGGTSLYSLDSGRAAPDVGGLAFHDVAVLFRLSAQGEAIEEALVQAGLPFHRVRDDALVARPFVGRVVESLRRLVEQFSKSPHLDPLPEGEGRFGKKPVAELIEGLDPTSRLDPRHRRAVDLLAALAVPFGTDAPGFLSSVAAMRDTDLALEPQKIALLTLHASKGLEFPLVFIAGCEDGLLPLRLPGIAPAPVEEERRLLYVGMTRAKQRLVLTCARTRNVLGRNVENAPCPFLSGLPPEVISDLRMPSRAKRARQLPLL